MQAKKTPKPDDPAEYRRFLETARKVEADETPGSFDRAFKKLIGAPKRNEKLSKNVKAKAATQ
jgi:hypothetical protein